MTLPTDRAARNGLPVWDGCIAYFPDVWAEVAKVSVLGNTQHNLGQRLHWNTHVSTDHKNKAMRHMLDDEAGEVMDDDGQTFHLAKAVWRLSAALQLRIWARDGKDEHGQIIPVDPPMTKAAAVNLAIDLLAEVPTKAIGACVHGRLVCAVCKPPSFARRVDDLQSGERAFDPAD